MMKKSIAMAAAAVVSLGMTGAAMADGAALYTAKMCATCHGPDGKTPTAPMYPKLAGQSEQYLLTQMKDIKSGARANGMTAAMKPMVAAVTDEEFAEIAKYLSGL